jgi:membrane protease YdiL (CAAX protease family)
MKHGPRNASGIAGRAGLAVLVFVAAAISPNVLTQLGADSLFGGARWVPYFFVKTNLIIASLFLIVFTGQNFDRSGFRRPVAEVPWGRLLFIGLGLGAVATILILSTPARGMPWLIRDLGFVGVVVWIWLYSSLSEEIFARGWFQSALSPWGETVIRVFGREVEVPVLASALLFGAMHLTLPFQGADAWTTAIIVLFTTSLGWVVADIRHRSGSLTPAVLVHVCFNVGGFLAGLAFVIGTSILTGQPPAR